MADVFYLNEYCVYSVPTKGHRRVHEYAPLQHNNHSKYTNADRKVGVFLPVPESWESCMFTLRLSMTERQYALMKLLRCHYNKKYASVYN